MKFRVGDKVKFVGVTPKKFVGKIGIINEVRPPKKEFPYSVRFPNSRSYFPVLRWEIEPVMEVGKQLLFSFMSK